MRAGAVKRVTIDEQAYTRLLVVREDLVSVLEGSLKEADVPRVRSSVVFAVDLLATFIGPLESIMLAGPADGPADFPEWLVYSMAKDELRCTRCKGCEEERLEHVRGRTYESLRLWASLHTGCPDA